jgi:hypothetical protein
MEPRGKSRAGPRNMDEAKNYVKMPEFREAKQISCLCPSAAKLRFARDPTRRRRRRGRRSKNH